MSEGQKGLSTDIYVHVYDTVMMDVKPMDVGDQPIQVMLRNPGFGAEPMVFLFLNEATAERLATALEQAIQERNRRRVEAAAAAPVESK